ncbi:hypothetical protein [Morganella morganii]|uniref:hypothetical protein n=1 Tax=Morganella morganii TaxID=582 RepID=UPI001648DB4A|nr:hypothetical protein [Morganella morganii]MBC3967962.1 hypothetical protein [Morganella morganii]
MNAYAVQDAQEERRLEHAAWQDAVARDFDEFTQDVIFEISTDTLEYLGTDRENEIREAIDKVLRKRSRQHGNGNLLWA